jgi:hypothetical protein
MPRRREEAAAQDGAATMAGGPYVIRKKDRFWAVFDSAGALVCITVYKRGAAEVVRRLGGVMPPENRRSGLKKTSVAEVTGVN